MLYQFEWDAAKETRNFQKHKVDFRRASSVFRDPNHISIYDDEHSDNEDRWITVGLDSGGVTRVVVHTFEVLSNDVFRVRVISARKATTSESEEYKQGI